MTRTTQKVMGTGRGVPFAYPTGVCFEKVTENRGYGNATSSEFVTFASDKTTSGNANDEKVTKINPLLLEKKRKPNSEPNSDTWLQSARKRRGRIWSIGLDRGFSKTDLKKLLDACTNDKYRIMFECMAYLGLRVSEAVKLNLRDIDLARKEIWLWNSKVKNRVCRELHPTIYYCLKSYIEKNRKLIEAYEGYLIWSQNTQGGLQPHISANQARKIFREASDRAGITEYYATIENSPGQPGRERRLRRLSSHSLRHFFICQVYEATKDPLVTQRAARHNSFSSTEHYLDGVENNVNKSVQKAFTMPWAEVEPKKDMNMQEFMEFFALFRQFKAARA